MDNVMLDASTKAIKKLEIFLNKPFNERISNSIKALHIGDVYGSFSKLLYFMARLIATSPPVTGTRIWINKMKKPNLIDCVFDLSRTRLIGYLIIK